MAYIPPIYYYANRNGILRLESIGVSVNATNVTFSFNGNPNSPYSGLVLVKLDQTVPEGTTTTLPVVFTSPYGGDKSVTVAGGAALTVADLAGTGVYLVFYDSAAGTVQLIG